jgi:hypothetical protein
VEISRKKFTKISFVSLEKGRKEKKEIQLELSCVQPNKQTNQKKYKIRLHEFGCVRLVRVS